MLAAFLSALTGSPDFRIPDHCCSLLPRENIKDGFPALDAVIDHREVLRAQSKLWFLSEPSSHEVGRINSPRKPGTFKQRRDSISFGWKWNL
jgi:hypothetical protein